MTAIFEKSANIITIFIEPIINLYIGPIFSVFGLEYPGLRTLTGRLPAWETKAFYGHSLPIGIYQRARAHVR